MSTPEMDAAISKPRFRPPLPSRRSAASPEMVNVKPSVSCPPRLDAMALALANAASAPATGLAMICQARSGSGAGGSTSWRQSSGSDFPAISASTVRAAARNKPSSPSGEAPPAAACDSFSESTARPARSGAAEMAWNSGVIWRARSTSASRSSLLR